MRSYRRWLLSLGLAAAMPVTGFAGPFDFLTRRGGESAQAQPAAQVQQAAPSEKQVNQQIANNVAVSLKRSGLLMRDVSIRVDKGVASVTGAILDHGQKSRASQVIRSVPGVRVVDNRMNVMQTPRAASPAVTDSAVRPASATAGSNEAVARKIATSLQEAGLKGFKIRIGYQDGAARLEGNVASRQQWNAVQQVVQGVPEVQTVDNRISVASIDRPSPNAGRPAQNVSMQRPAGPLMPPGNPYAGGMPAGPAPGPAPVYAHGGPGSAMPTYTQPNLPSHAWPSYAAYPNSAAVSYPTQYSASAWPYIGPFYPYPQVPLGWRRAELEWDDGQWSLQFHSKTDRWWWFLNPENWD